MERGWRLAAALFVLLFSAAPARPQTASDRELVKGIRQVEDGYLEDAATTLEAVARRLAGQPARSRDLAQAYLYLGIAYAQLDTERAARASFREALNRNPDLTVDAGRWPPKVLRLFTAVQAEVPPPSSRSPTERVAASPTTLKPEWLRGDRGQAGLGIGTVSLSEETRRRLDLPTLPGAFRIVYVHEPSPAAQAGLRIDDVIRKVDGKLLRGSAYNDLILSRAPGEQVSLEVWRAGRPMDLAVVLFNEFAFYGEACEKGVARACSALAQFYLFGAGSSVPPDRVQAAALARRGCEGRDSFGCFVLGVLYQRGRGIPKDEARAFALFKQACQDGWPEGCHSLGVAYADAAGVAKDDARAFALFKEACAGGFSGACPWQGAFLESGRGVPKHEPQAVALFQQACDNGVPDACSNLGNSYWDGRGIAKDQARAIALYRDACDLGGSRGCSLLGERTFNGAGVPKDEPQGVALMRRGCAAGDTWGCDQLKKLGQALQ